VDGAGPGGQRLQLVARPADLAAPDAVERPAFPGDALRALGRQPLCQRLPLPGRGIDAMVDEKGLQASTTA
jgi:hypothetical protein